MKKLIFFSLMVLVASACHHDCVEPDPGPRVCGVANPAENLPWLKTIIDDFKKDTTTLASLHYVQQSTYHGNTVFIIGTCIPWCELSCFSIMDCEGKDLGFPLGLDLDGPATVIWKAENSSCTFGS
ncbi:hypothetical protein [Chryseolinea soli]|nr:hypothetical protein [Chryseolinea soli]